MESMEIKSFGRNKRVLITGHTGFKGSWLSFWLNQLGAEVFGYSLKPDDDQLLFSQLKLENNINHQIGDISDQTLFSDYLLDCEPDFIFHLAAQSLVLESYVDTLGTWQTNVMGDPDIIPLSFKKAIIEPENVIAPTAAPMDISTKLANLILPKEPRLKA